MDAGKFPFRLEAAQQPRFSTYLAYGVALPIAAAVLALGVFTLLGYKPLAPYFTNHMYRKIFSGGMIAIGASTITGLFWCYHRTVGFDPLTRVEMNLPTRVNLTNGSSNRNENSTTKTETRWLSIDQIKKECFARVEDNQAFKLPTLQKGEVVYIHIQGGFYYKFEGEQAKRVADRAFSYQDILQQPEIARGRERREIQIEHHIVPRLLPGESVVFKGRAFNCFSSGLVTCDNEPLGTEVDLSTLITRANQREVSKAKPKSLHIPTELIPRLNPGECFQYDKLFYCRISESQWGKSRNQVGKMVSVMNIMKRSKPDNATLSCKEIPTRIGVEKYIDKLGDGEAIYYSDGETISSYVRIAQLPKFECQKLCNKDRVALSEQWMFDDNLTIEALYNNFQDLRELKVPRSTKRFELQLQAHYYCGRLHMPLTQQYVATALMHQLEEGEDQFFDCAQTPDELKTIDLPDSSDVQGTFVTVTLVRKDVVAVPYQGELSYVYDWELKDYSSLKTVSLQEINDREAKKKVNIKAMRLTNRLKKQVQRTLHAHKASSVLRQEDIAITEEVQKNLEHWIQREQTGRHTKLARPQRLNQFLQARD